MMMTKEKFYEMQRKRYIDKYDSSDVEEHIQVMNHVNSRQFHNDCDYEYDCLMRRNIQYAKG